MERSWFGTVRLMELEIGVMVVVVLMGLVVITARLARDPSEPAARWLLDRARSARPVPAGFHPSEVVTPAAAKTVTAGSVVPEADERAPTPEWLDRLLGRGPRREAGSTGNANDQPDGESGRRVA